MTDKEAASMHKQAGRIVPTILLATLLAFALEFVTDASLVSEFARSMAARIFAPYTSYIYSRANDAQAVKDKILIVDVGAPTLQSMRSTGTVSYGQHARILERIRAAKPAAVFLDFQFQSQREDESLNQLQKTLCAYKEEGIPVFMAAGSEIANGRLRPELENLRNGQGQPCFTKVAVSYESSEIDHIVWSYPLVRSVGEEPMPSAALAMARVIHGDALAEVDSHALMGLSWASASHETGPSWQYQPENASHANENLQGKHYCRPTTWRDLVPLQAILTRSISFANDPRPQCPLHNSIQASQLTGLKTAEETQSQIELISNRLILYGGSYDSSDFINSPLHGEIPGIYLHAQATDNLILYGSNWRHPTMGGAWGHSVEHLMTLIAFLSVTMCFVFARGGLRRMGQALMNSLEPTTPYAKLQTTKNTLSRCHKALKQSKARYLYSLSNKVIGNLFAQLGRFVVGVLMAIPFSWAMEEAIHISAIGYGSILAFCLMGEVIVGTTEIEEDIGTTNVTHV